MDYLKVQEYVLIKINEISEGYLAINQNKIGSDPLLFVKRISLENQNKLREHEKESELLIAPFLNHPNIIKCVENKLRTKNNHYFIYEYCEIGNLSEFLIAYNYNFDSLPSEKIIHKIIKGIAQAITKIHQENIIHRDLQLKHIHLNYVNFRSLCVKHEKNYFGKNLSDVLKNIKNDFVSFSKNFLFKFKENISKIEFEEFFLNNIDIKIIDLGLAKLVDTDEGNNNLNKTFIMNELASPEMKNKQNYGFSTDMWSLGIITHFLMTNNNLSDNFNEGLEYENKDYSSKLNNFMNCLLKVNPNLRINYRTIFHHPFLSSNTDNKLLEENFLNSTQIENNNKGINDIKLEEENDEINQNCEINYEEYNEDSLLNIDENYFDKMYSRQIVVNIIINATEEIKLI